MAESIQAYYEKLIAQQTESVRKYLVKYGLTEWETVAGILTYEEFEFILDGYRKGRVHKANAIFNKLVAKNKLKNKSSLKQLHRKTEKLEHPKRSQNQDSLKETNTSPISFTNEKLPKYKEVKSIVDLYVQLRDALSVRAKNVLLYNDIYYFDDFYRFISTDNNQFGNLRNCGKKTVKELDELARLILCYEKKPSSILDIPVKDLGLSIRTLNSLIDSHIETLGELVSFEKADIRSLYGLGEKSLREIEEAVYSKGLWFGFDIKSVHKKNETKPQVTSDIYTLNNDVATIENEQDKVIDNSIFNVPIEDLGLSARAFNCLEAAGIETLGDLVALKKTDLLKFRNLGKKSVQEIEELIISKDLRLGMNLSKYNTVRAKESQALEPLVSKFPVFRLLSKYDLDYSYVYKEKFGHFPMAFLTYKSLGALSNREQDVLRMVWGLNSFSINSNFNIMPDFSSCSIGLAQPKSINVIAAEFGISRQRTHQILQKANRRIRKIDKSLLRHDDWAYYGIVNDSSFLFSNDFEIRSIRNEREYLLEYIRNGWGTNWMNSFLGNIPLISESYLCFFMFVKGMIPFWINNNETTLSRRYSSTDPAMPSFFVNNQLGHFAYERVIKETHRLKEVKKTEIVSVPIMSYFINDANYWNQNYRPTTIEKDNLLRLLIRIFQTFCKVQIENDSIVFNPNVINYCDFFYEILKTARTRLHRDELFKRFMGVCSEKGIPNRYTDSYQITPFLTRDSRIVPFGKSSYWGLREWGGLVGSIKEIAIEIVSKSETPIHIDELTKRVMGSRPDSNEKSVSSIIRQTTISGELLLFFGDYIGSPNRTYEEELFIMPQSFDDWLQAFKNFVIKYKRFPFYNQDSYEGCLYRWHFRASKLTELSSEEILKFDMLEKELAHYPQNATEYNFLQNCNLYKAYVESNKRMITKEDDADLFFWFYNASRNYTSFKDNRNVYFSKLLHDLSSVLY